ELRPATSLALLRRCARVRPTSTSTPPPTLAAKYAGLSPATKISSRDTRQRLRRWRCKSSEGFSLDGLRTRQAERREEVPRRLPFGWSPLSPRAFFGFSRIQCARGVFINYALRNLPCIFSSCALVGRQPRAARE